MVNVRRARLDVELWAQELIKALQHHLDSEREALVQYGTLIDDTPDDRVRFLVQMILDDEVRHHQLFAEMIKRLRSELEQRGTSALPPMRTGRGDPRLREQTTRLLALERDDIKELRELRKELAKVADTEWWSVLAEVMAADNRKHIKLLEFVRDHL